MVFFHGLHGGARIAGTAVGGRGMQRSTRFWTNHNYMFFCHECCKMCCYEFCMFQGAVDSKELDRVRYKVTKREKQWYFERADTNKNGVLERAEVRKLLDSIKKIPDPAFASTEGKERYQDIGLMSVPAVSDAELDLLIRLASRQSGDTVGPNDIGKLIVLHRVVSRNRHVINEVFDRFDRDGNGFLNAKELTAFMTDIDPRATEQERAALLDKFFEVDKDSDGLISRDEMLASMAYWKEMVASARSQASFKKWCGCLRPEEASSSVSPEQSLSQKSLFASGVAGEPVWVIPASEVQVVTVAGESAGTAVPAAAVMQRD